MCFGSIILFLFLFIQLGDCFFSCTVYGLGFDGVVYSARFVRVYTVYRPSLMGLLLRCKFIVFDGVVCTVLE